MKPLQRLDGAGQTSGGRTLHLVRSSKFECGVTEDAQAGNPYVPVFVCKEIRLDCRKYMK